MIGWLSGCPLGAKPPNHPITQQQSPGDTKVHVNLGFVALLQKRPTGKRNGGAFPPRDQEKQGSICLAFVMHRSRMPSDETIVAHRMTPVYPINCLSSYATVWTYLPITRRSPGPFALFHSRPEPSPPVGMSGLYRCGSALAAVVRGCFRTVRQE